MSSKEKVLEMSDEDFKQYVWGLTLATARSMFDWTGCKPIIKHDGALPEVIGRVEIGAENYIFLNYDGRDDVWTLTDFDKLGEQSG